MIKICEKECGSGRAEQVSKTSRPPRCQKTQQPEAHRVRLSARNKTTGPSSADTVRDDAWTGHGAHPDQAVSKQPRMTPRRVLREFREVCDKHRSRIGR